MRSLNLGIDRMKLGIHQDILSQPVYQGRPGLNNSWLLDHDGASSSGGQSSTVSFHCRLSWFSAASY